VQSFTYNAAGQVTSEQAPGDLGLEFLYNPRNLLSGLKGGFGSSIAQVFDGILYDHRGAAVQTDSQNGTRTAAWYDSRARLWAVATGPKATLSWKQSPWAAQPQAIQHQIYHRTPTGLLSQLDDLTQAKPGFPRFDATYAYDRLYQLTGANTPHGKFTYAYDEIQNFTQRTLVEPNATILGGIFGYAERGAGPNQITSAGNQTFEYDKVGQMKQYKGFDLTFDVEGRLVKAKRNNGPTLEYHYDDTGARKLAIVKRPGKPDKIHRFVNGRYQIRDGEETWILGAGLSQAEVRQTQGLRVDLPLLDELTAYVQNPTGKKKPLPQEFMDLSGDGKGFDANDLEVAYQAYWNDVPAGGPRKVWKYTLKDHLGGTTHTVDSRGQVVSHQQYHPYGKTAHRDGQRPTYGFAGSEIEEEEELGLMQFGARWYAPEIGRWVSADPLFVGAPNKNVESPLESGLYSYVANGPTNATDPTGLYKGVTNARVSRYETVDSEGVPLFKDVIQFDYQDDRGNAYSGYLDTLTVQGVEFDDKGNAVSLENATVSWRDRASGQRMHTSLNGFLQNNSYAVFYDSRATFGFGSHEVMGGFFMDSAIEAYKKDIVYNKLSNIGDTAGAASAALALVPEPSLSTKVSAAVLGAFSSLVSVGTSIRSASLANDAYSKTIHGLNSAGQGSAFIYGQITTSPAKKAISGGVAVFVSQYQKFFSQVRHIEAIGTDTTSKAYTVEQR
jgi:RHS repeat-associated protein